MVTQIYTNLKIEQSVASKHLRILSESKIVEREKKGKAVFYKPNYNHLTKLQKIISDLFRIDETILLFLVGAFAI